MTAPRPPLGTVPHADGGAAYAGPAFFMDGERVPFTPGQTILQVANANNVVIPQYCYHDGLSIVAS